MKQIFIWATALTMSLALFSCDKKKTGLETSLKKEEQIEKPSSIRGKIYTATNEVLSFESKSDNKKEEDLRASILNTGYHKPTLDVTKEEFVSKGLKAHWFILGQSTKATGSVTNFLNSVPNTAPSNSSLVFYKEGNKRKLKMYCRIEDDNFKVKDKFAMLALDGNLRDGRYLDFKGTIAPNQKLVGLKNGQELKGYHLPIMTDILPFNKVFNKQHTVHYKSRGVLIALSVINNSCQAVQVKRIVLEGNNALWFEGSFDTQIAMDNTNIFSKSSQGITTTYKAKFIGSKSNTPITCSVYNGASPAYKIDKMLDQTITSAVKEAAPVFYIWGYPRDNNKQLKFKIIYTDFGSSEEKTKVCAVNPPNLGFQEGKAYQLPVVLSQFIRPENPLDFVGEYSLNLLGDGFVLNQNLPNTSIPFQMTTNDVGYFLWSQAVNLFDETNKPEFLKQYVLPSIEDWQSILPTRGSPNLVLFDRVYYKRSYTWEIPLKVGGSPVIPTSVEYITVSESGKFVTYAHRFICSEWDSAWRYSFEGEGNNRKIVIKSVSLKGINNRTLEGFSNPEFFNKNNVTTRVFPTYGYHIGNPAGDPVSYLGERHYSWSSSSKYEGANIYYFLGNELNACLDNSSAVKTHYKFTIRPFYKQLP